MKLQKSASKRKLSSTIKSLAALAIAGASTYLIQSYFEIPKYLVAFFLVGLTYVEYRINWLKEKIGLTELPTFTDQLDFLRQKGATPKHIHADTRTYPMRLSENEQQFFDDFSLFAEVANNDLQDTPWRLQTLADTDVGTLESDGPMFGRKYAILFGPKKNGTLEIHNMYNYDLNSPIVHVNIEIYNARRFPLWLLGSFISGIEDLTCNQANERSDVHTRLNTGMLKVLWPLTNK